MKFLATINVPGYLPMDDDPPTFDTAREAWDYLADARRDGEDAAFDASGAVADPDDGGYSSTVNTLERLAEGNFDPFFGADEDGTGYVYGDTPGYDGDHDLGLAYSVSVVEPCDVHTVEWDGEECIVCGQATPMPETFTINERVLTNDTVTWAPEGFTFEDGHVAIVTYHVFQNANSDKAMPVGFATVEQAEAFIVERYGKTSDQLIYDTDEEE